MSFRTMLDIGCFDREQAADGFIARPLTASEIDAAIVGSGGRLLADVRESEPQLTVIARGMVQRGGQDVRGFLGRDVVVRHPDGYVRVAFDGRSAEAVATILRLLRTEFGCEVYVWDHDEQEAAEVISWLENLEELRPA